jgi:hypothetical protein
MVSIAGKICPLLFAGSNKLCSKVAYAKAERTTNPVSIQSIGFHPVFFFFFFSLLLRAFFFDALCFPEVSAIRIQSVISQA